MSSEMWVEKYRPKSLDAIINQEDIVNRLKKFVESKTMPHCLFSGPPGTGKTSAALALANDLFSERFMDSFMELNASDERGINVIRERVKTFARTRTFGEVPFKILVLDEADNMCLTGDTMVVVGRRDYKCGYRLHKIEDVDKRKYVPMPSVNLETWAIEEDYGKCIDSGYAVFYKITLEDGWSVNASANHPFFVYKEGKFTEAKVIDLREGDEIVDYGEAIFPHFCEVCGQRTFNKRFCSRKCQNTGRRLEVKIDKNLMYGKPAWKKGKTKSNDPRVAKQGLLDGKNSSTRPEVKEKRQRHMLRLWRDSNARRRLLSGGCSFWKRHRGIPDAEVMDKEVVERKRRLASSTYREKGIFLDSRYRRYLAKPGCEACGEPTRVGGRDGIYVHHKDGDHKNNEESNLMFVCPRCHNDILHPNPESIKKAQRTSQEGNTIVYARQFLRCRTLTDGGVGLVKVKKIENIGVQKAWNITMKKNKNFILGIGLLTHNTSDAQQALRRTMERYTETCRFILLCNYSTKIIEPIQSRCAIFRFTPLNDRDITGYLKHIAEKEQINITDEGVYAILDVCEGDMRKAINTLQASAALGKTVDAKTIYSVVGRAHPREIGEMLTYALNGRFVEAREKLRKMLIEYGLSGSDITRQIHREIFRLNIPEKWKISLIDITGEVDYRLAQGANEEVQLSSLLAKFVLAREK